MMNKFNQLYEIKEEARDKLMQDIYEQNIDIPLDLTDNTLFNPVSGSKKFDAKLFQTKTEMADKIISSLPKNSSNEVDDSIFSNLGLWSWLSLALAQSVYSDDNGNLNFHKKRRWYFIPSGLQDFQTGYRHLILIPVLLRYRYGNKVDHHMTSNINVAGEINEQLLSQQDFWEDYWFELGNMLYYDNVSKKIKKDAGGKKEGSARRLVSFFNQISVTYDTASLGAKGIYDLLPKEFDAFKK